MHAQHCGVQHCGSTGQAALRFESVLTNNPDPNLTNISNTNPSPNQAALRFESVLTNNPDPNLTNISNPNPNPNPNPGGAAL